MCDVGRLDLTDCMECGTKIIDGGEENQALVNMIMAPFVRYKEVLLDHWNDCYKSSLLYVGFLCRSVVMVFGICDHNLHG